MLEEMIKHMMTLSKEELPEYILKIEGWVTARTESEETKPELLRITKLRLEELERI
jgi:hypothetical protein